MSKHIGRRVKITNYPKYENKYGTVLVTGGFFAEHCFRVQLDEGSTIHAWSPDKGDQAEFEWVDETHQEALNRLNLQIGDRVKILYKSNSNERGWCAIWNPQMDKNIGENGVEVKYATQMVSK